MGFTSGNHTQERFDAKWIPEPNSGCWIWTGATSNKGYGSFRFEGRTQAAHRVSYRLHRGEIPTGLHIDHLCRTSACVNPDHMEPVTPYENAKRGVGAEITKQRYLKQTHCKRGHPLSGDNIYVGKGYAKRVCKTCRRVHKRESYQRLKAKHNIPNRGNYNKLKTHCPKGHSYTEKNLRIEATGARRCRTCHREQEALRRTKIKEVTLGIR